MGWDEDHLHRFRFHGRDYGISYVGGPSFDEDAAAVRLAQFGFRPTERFLYEYDFTAGWPVEVRVEKVIEDAPYESYRIPACLASRELVLWMAAVGLRPMRNGVAMRSAGTWRPIWGS
jgi:hypothetical protein